MKRKQDHQSETKDFKKLEKLLEGKFDLIENQLKAVDRNQRVVDQKNLDAFRELRLELTLKATETRQEFERTLRAELQVTNTELGSRIEERFSELNGLLKIIEERINERITNVGDLITVELGKKIQTHAKRITHLERISAIA